MLKYTRTTMEKLIDIFEDLEYVVRFEKGHFQSGYAVVHDKKIVIINKFFDLEARINALMEILDKIDVEEVLLDQKSKVFYHFLLKESLIKPAEK